MMLFVLLTQQIEQFHRSGQGSIMSLNHFRTGPTYILQNQYLLASQSKRSWVNICLLFDL